MKTVSEAARILDFYAQPGVLTAAGSHSEALTALPTDVAELAAVLQGLIVHEHLAAGYGVELTEEGRRAVHIRPVGELVSLIVARDGRPLDDSRPPSARIAGNCRHFTTLMVAVLRAQGVPARGRCGFGGYFVPGRFEDHWVCEYWRPDEQRWALVDAQVDDLQRERLGITFDLTDLPRDQFLVGGDAWASCRSGIHDPNVFGLSLTDEAGYWWIASNLMRDLAALRKVEVLPWDSWGRMPGPETEIGEEFAATLDRLAVFTHSADEFFDEIARVSESNDGITLRDVIHNDVLDRDEPISAGASAGFH